MISLRGASGGCLHGGASLKGDKAHFDTWKKGPENRKNEVKLAPPSVPPPEALYHRVYDFHEIVWWRTADKIDRGA